MVRHPSTTEKGGTCPHGRGGEPNRKPMSIARRLVAGDMMRGRSPGDREGGGRGRGAAPAAPPVDGDEPIHAPFWGEADEESFASSSARPGRSKLPEVP